MPENKRIGIVLRSVLLISSQELRFDVTLYVAGAEQFLSRSQKRNGEGNVKFHVKRSRSQNHCADTRRIIVHPSRDTDCGKAVSENNHVLNGNVVAFRDMMHKSVNILNHVGKTIGRSAFARRSPMPARIPRENGDVFKAE